MNILRAVSIAAAVALASGSASAKPWASLPIIAGGSWVHGAVLVTWRQVGLVASRGGDVLMQVADPDRSDIGLVGMIIRCRDREVEPLIVILDPLPPRAQAKVRIEANAVTETMEATLVPTGAGLALPIAIADRMSTDWQTEPDLGIDVQTPSSTIKGTISLKGVRALMPSFV